METPIKIHDLGGNTPYFWKHPSRKISKKKNKKNHPIWRILFFFGRLDVLEAREHVPVPIRTLAGPRRMVWEDCWKCLKAEVVYIGVSKNRGIPKSSILIGFFHYKPFILWYHYFWKHPYNPGQEIATSAEVTLNDGGCKGIPPKSPSLRFRNYTNLPRILDLFKVIFYGLYHGKSPSNHHLGEYVLLLSKHLMQILSDVY